MLLRLDSSRVSELWDQLAPAVAKGAMPGCVVGPDRLNLILSALMKDQMWCWLLMSKDKDGMGAVITTTVAYDMFADVRNMLIYSCYEHLGASPVEWIKALKTIMKFAKSKGCERIIGFSDNENVIDFIYKLKKGFKVTYLEVEV